MAQSKRAKVVHLTKVARKDKAAKGALYETVQDAARRFSRAYVFSVANMRNRTMKDVRGALGDRGRILIGKNRVMALALGRSADDEVVPGGSQLGEKLVGGVGVLFTDMDAEELQALLARYSPADYARTGGIADTTVVVCAPEDEAVGLRSLETNEPIPATAEPGLRAAGMPTRLRGGAVLLDVPEFAVCAAGDVLTSDQARLLKAMGVRMAQFSVRLLCCLSKGVLSNF